MLKNTYNFSIKLLVTTETELKAIATEAIQGCNIIPKGLKIPAAKGIPIMLYMLAKRKFILIRRTVFFERSKQATTSNKSFCKKKNEFFIV